MKEFAEAFYTSNAWKECRNTYRKMVGGLCERCLRDGIVTAGEIVHHKIHLTPMNINEPDVTLNFKNLELLCRECHAAVHGNKRRYSVAADGKVSAR